MAHAWALHRASQTLDTVARTWSQMRTVPRAWGEGCSLGGSISDSSEQLLQRDGEEVSRYVVLVQRGIRAIKHTR